MIRDYNSRSTYETSKAAKPVFLKAETPVARKRPNVGLALFIAAALAFWIGAGLIVVAVAGGVL